MPKEYIEYQNEITSADDLNKKGRQSDVLIEALNKCQVIEKQRGIAREGIRDIQRLILINNGRLGECHREYKLAEKILKRIEEVK